MARVGKVKTLNFDLQTVSVYELTIFFVFFVLSGHYKAGTSTALCAECEDGWYQEKAGQSECFECPAGFFCPVSFIFYSVHEPGRVAQSVGHLTHKSGVPGSIPGLATYFRFSFRFFKKGSCQLLAKVCAQSTG